MRDKLTQYSVEGSVFITQSGFGKFLGVSRGTARKYLEGIEAIDGKYYYIPDVVDHLWAKKAAGGGR